MEAKQILHELRGQGFKFQVNGDRLRVAPAHRLTDDVRAVLRANKSELLEALVAGTSEPPRMRPTFEFELSERPGAWHTLLAQHGDTVEDARQWCNQRFGADRVVGVRERLRVVGADKTKGDQP